MSQIDLLHTLCQETGLDQVGSPLIYYSGPTTNHGSDHTDITKALENNGLVAEAKIFDFSFGRGLDADMENGHFNNWVSATSFDVDQFLNVQAVSKDLETASLGSEHHLPTLTESDLFDELFADSTLAMTPKSVAAEVSPSPAPSEEVLIEEGPSEEVDMTVIDSPQPAALVVKDEVESESESIESIVDELDNMVYNSKPADLPILPESVLQFLLTMKPEEEQEAAPRAFEQEVPQKRDSINYLASEVGSPYSVCSNSSSSEDDVAFSPVEVASELTANQVVASTSRMTGLKRKNAADDSDSDYTPEADSKRAKCQGGRSGSKRPKSKRDQNREAAHRYRTNKKVEAERVESELGTLFKEHADLLKEAEGLFQKRSLMMEIIGNLQEVGKMSVQWPAWHKS